MARKANKKKASPKKGRGAKGGETGRWRQLAGSFLFGEALDDDSSARVRELGGLVLVGMSLWLLLSMATFITPREAAPAGSNLGGALGHYLADGALSAVGLSGYLLAALGILWGSVIIARKEVRMPILRLVGVVFFVLGFAFVLDLGFGPDMEARKAFLAARNQAAIYGEQIAGADVVLSTFSADLPFGTGGWLALVSNPGLVERFGEVGLWIVLLTIVGISALLATEMAFYTAITSFGDWLDDRRERMGEEFLPAVGGWAKRLFVGIWDFLRGADLSASAAGSAKKSTRKSSRSKAGKKASTKKATTKPKAPKKPKELPDLDGLDDVDEPEDELEDGEEYEYEYVDEDGNPIDPSELDEYEEEDEDAEYEEDGELEDDEEWEYEDEDDVLQPAAKRGASDDEEDEYEDDDAESDAEFDRAAEEASAKAKRAAAAAMRRAATMERKVYDPPTPPPGPWELPPFDLLEAPEANIGLDKEFLETSAQNLENALRSFRVEAEVVGAQVGPAVTMFELTVAQGTRMSKVTTLSQEIAATLRARNVRIVAPIPGKSTIGIEVPNATRRTVRISELVTQKAYDTDYMALPLFLGMDAEGKSIVEDLARAPHMLIAGTTGSGKSVCINTIIASFLLTRSPHDVKLILVDPKMVELQMFEKIPHLELPVVTDMKQATNVLQWAVEKMESRYELFMNAGVKNIKTYNKLGEDKLREKLGDEFSENYTPRHVPYIVLVIDEMADLMMQAKKEAEGAITRLAQKSRAVGIHVIVATQRPSTDVITGVIKGNLPTRIAFQVASKIDSRVILDCMGAEKLLGQGDMLYAPPSASQVIRVQGALVEDHELQALVDHVCKHAAPNFDQQLVQTATGSAPPGELSQGGEKADEMFNEAVTVVLKYRRGSASLLQRALGIGYTRASRLIDQMTDAGILGPHKGSKAREIFMTLEDWEENQANLDRAG
ncbi:DNA translocase FtsK [Saltatorellus ferox]|uniref:DNA translocase FtsK n=1 Tax=Saltatorellus ferox TaxID=2528018 RepID=UPI003AF34B41